MNRHRTNCPQASAAAPSGKPNYENRQPRVHGSMAPSRPAQSESAPHGPPSRLAQIGVSAAKRRAAAQRRGCRAEQSRAMQSRAVQCSAEQSLCAALSLFCSQFASHLPFTAAPNPPSPLPDLPVQAKPVRGVSAPSGDMTEPRISTIR